ncbi:MAG TPA: hypothetical protein PKC43_06275 [Phycisphaerales bacterium]|nr:hypothetical protein [Phycisphaerales bacterium]HMP37038.1 hypothetical protein [Phycisphaerales bacterium]
MRITIARTAIFSLIGLTLAAAAAAFAPPPPRETVDIGTQLIAARVEIRLAQVAAVEGRIADETGHLARAYSSVGSVLSALGADYDDGEEIARHRQRLQIPPPAPEAPPASTSVPRSIHSLR